MNGRRMTTSGAMRAWMAWLFFVPAVLSAEAVAPALTFARYEVILSRKPFGEPPARPAPVEKTAIMVPYNFFDDLHMVAVTERERGIRVGFINRKTNKDYFLYVGETEDGITLVSADYDEGKAIVRKGEQEGEIRFRKGMDSGPAPGPETPEKRDVPAFLQNRMSYLERNRERQAKLQKDQEDRQLPAALRGEDLEKHIEKYQMEVIRKGLPPLPVPLTEEMDTQLVKEGVLPAREEE